MRILNVNSSIDLRSGGGTAERTYQMSRALAQQGATCTILTLNIGLDADRINSVRPATVVALDCLWLRFQVPRGGWRTIRQLVQEADVIHLMGHWSVLNVVVYLAARRACKPYVVCPAGALPLFGRSAWLKRGYNVIAGKAIIRNASAWIAVTAAEFPQFGSYGVPKDRVTVIPNGVRKKDFDHCDKAFLAAYDLKDVPTILFMGRLNLIKGPDLLLQAFAQVCDSLPDLQLVFAGPDGGMLSQLQASVANYRLMQRVHFLGHIDGEIKSTLYRFASLLVVPSRQEAMSIVALEAGVCGTPVLLTDQCGFGEIRTVDRRMEVPATVDGLAEGLVRLLTDPIHLAEIGQKWRQFVESRYTWEVLVPIYLKLYKEMLCKDNTE